MQGLKNAFEIKRSATQNTHIYREMIALMDKSSDSQYG